MNQFFQILQLLLLLCGTVLGIVFVILLALPQSKLRDVLMPIVGWTMALFCGAYCLSPFDICPEAFLGPFGLVDDVGALVTGIAAARTAMAASKSR